MTRDETAAAMPASAHGKCLSTRGRSVSRCGVFTDYSHGMNSQGLAAGWVRTALDPNGVIGTKRWLAARTTGDGEPRLFPPRTVHRERRPVRFPGLGRGGLWRSSARGAGGCSLGVVVRQRRGPLELQVERRRFSWSHSVGDVLHTREAATTRPSGSVARSKPWWMSSAGLWPAALVQWTARPGATVTSAEHTLLLTR